MTELPSRALERIYFDNAATTPIDPRVVEAMMPYLTEHHGNPSSIHAHGRRTRAAIETSRRKVAELLNVTPGEIIFTSGGTEADNMALRCAARDLGIKNIITSSVEHHAVGHTCDHLGHDGRVAVHHVSLGNMGHVDLEHLEELLSSTSNVLVSLMHANNEVGNRISLTRTGELCQKYDAFFHSDTVQTMGHYSFDLQAIPVDMIAASAHKFNGPKGVGFLYVRNGITLDPMLRGGSQERNMRAGTECVYAIVGLAKALEIANEELADHQRHISELKQHMKQRLKDEIPGVQFNGDPGPDSLYTVLNVRFPEDGRSEMLLYNLDIEGISASGGSACSSGSSVGSHVIAAIHPGATGAAIRFSFGRFNTMEEVDRCVETLKRIFEPVKV